MSTFDRDKAREVLIDCALGTDLDVVLDALAACVVDNPHTIDRDELIRVLYEWNLDSDIVGLADRILALVRPADGPFS